MKKANGGKLFMLDLFDLAEKFSYNQIIFVTESVFFIRSKDGDGVDIFENQFLKNFGKQHVLVFTSEYTDIFYQELKKLFISYDCDYRFISGERIYSKDFPYRITYCIIGNFGF